IDDFTVELEYGYVHGLIGKAIPVETIKSIVTSLEMRIVAESELGITLKIPAYRVDVQRPCDVVEDILRIYGYNNVEIPTSLKSCISVKGDTDKSNKLMNLVAEQLVGCGFNEILNNSLTKAAYYDNLQSYPSKQLVRLMNPLSNDLNVLRQTLLFGGLESIAHNANRKNADLRFFEYGNCYRFNEERKCADIIPGVSKSTDPEVIKHVLDAYYEDDHMGLWLTGKHIRGSWAHADMDTSVYELKGYLLNIFARLGLNLGSTVFAASKNDIYAKGVEIQNRGGKVLAQFGIVSKKILKAFDIDNEVYFADICWRNVMKAIKSNKVTYYELAKFPAVSRDLALLVDKQVEFVEIERIAYSCEKKLLQEVKLFDVYEGKNLEPGKKSYAVNFVLQDPNKTMNDKQTDAIMGKII
ncbi:MAG: phenylalanine--tRNA ligase subunit beta, partial [Bacteroidaceae bacterium]|nr:phenylalanine--tRNA ligase subunit beta [Bacteroidaceae bacterium]